LLSMPFPCVLLFICLFLCLLSVMLFLCIFIWSSYILTSLLSVSVVPPCVLCAVPCLLHAAGPAGNISQVHASHPLFDGCNATFVLPALVLRVLISDADAIPSCFQGNK
jgi:hypothetical protein